MRRLFLPGELSDTVTLTGSDAHHVGYTLRARRGDRFIVVGAERQTAAMEITAFTKDTVTLRRVAKLDADTEPPIELGLAICLLKGDKLDFAVQKAVELGAAFIQPLRSENCVVRYDAKKAAVREEKWRRVAAEAAKQCGRTLVPRVEPVCALAAWLKELPADSAVFMAYEKERAASLRSWLQKETSRSFVALIGPEGGFTPAEAEAARTVGVHSVTLGPRILRAETAALAALAAVMYEKGDWGTE